MTKFFDLEEELVVTILSSNILIQPLIHLTKPDSKVQKCDIPI